MPNIIGMFSGNQDYTPNGAFGLVRNWISNSGAYEYANVIDFNASRCSPIYGRSEHVTPENYTMRIWKRTA